MTKNNSVNAPFPIPGSAGGSGIASPTAHTIPIAQGAAPFNLITMLEGQVLIGTTSGDPVAAYLTPGANVAFSYIPGSGSINVYYTGNLFPITFNPPLGGSPPCTPGGLYPNTATSGTSVLTLPLVAAAGTKIIVTGANAGSFWKIQQNAGQYIQYGSTSTTVGTGGSISAAQHYSSLTLLCILFNTQWAVISSEGTFTIV
jgi:hypothetical protein